MIGVAFALHEAFGIADGVERIAFEHVVYEFARQRRANIDSSAVERIARTNDAEFATPATLAQAFSTVLGPTLLPSGAHDAELEAMFRAAAADIAGQRFVAFPDAAPALRRLTDMRVPRVALSAGWPTIDQCKADIVGFDGSIVFAQNLGVSAQMPSAFARVARTLALPAERIWFIGSDARSEVLPASAAGFHTIWLNRNAGSFPAGRPAPDATIGSLAELFEVISEPYTRGLLALRHILRTALEWRPGHFLAGDDAARITEHD